MPGRMFGVVKRTAFILMLLTTALWLALLSIVFAQWFAAGTDQWTLSLIAEGAPAETGGDVEAVRVEQMWAQRLAQAVVAGPAVLVLTALLTRVRPLIWLCFGLLIAAGVLAMYIR